MTAARDLSALLASADGGTLAYALTLATIRGGTAVRRFGEAVEGHARAVNTVREAAPGPAPRDGLKWKDETKRWVSADTGEDAALTPHESGTEYKFSPTYKTTSGDLAAKAVAMAAADPSRKDELANDLSDGLSQRFRSNLKTVAAHFGAGVAALPEYRDAYQRAGIEGHLTAVRKAFHAGDPATLDAAITEFRRAGVLAVYRASDAAGDRLKAGRRLPGDLTPVERVVDRIAATGRTELPAMLKTLAASKWESDSTVLAAVTAAVTHEKLSPKTAFRLAAKTDSDDMRAAVVAGLPAGGSAPWDDGARQLFVTPDAGIDPHGILAALPRVPSLMGGGVKVYQVDADTAEALESLWPDYDTWDDDGAETAFDNSPQSEKIAVADVPAHAKTDLGDVSPDWDSSQVVRYKRLDKDRYVRYDPKGKPSPYTFEYTLPLATVVRATDVPPLIGVQAHVLESVEPDAALWVALLDDTRPVRESADYDVIPPELLAAVLVAQSRGDTESVRKLKALAEDKDALAAACGHLAESVDDRVQECDDPAYRRLSEADRSHLVYDRTKKRWVNPNKTAPVRKTPAEIGRAHV